MKAGEEKNIYTIFLSSSAKPVISGGVIIAYGATCSKDNCVCKASIH